MVAILDNAAHPEPLTNSIWVDPSHFRTRAGKPKSRYSFDDRLALLGGGTQTDATRHRLKDFCRLFAFRQTDAIITKVGQGPRAWTKLPEHLNKNHVARHLLADLIPNRPPTWVGSRSFITSTYICIDVDADKSPDPGSYTLDELHTLGKRVPKEAKPKPRFDARVLTVEKAFRRLGVDPDNPRQVLIQRTPRGGRHYYMFLDEPHPLDELDDLLYAAGLEHKPGEIEFYPSTAHALRLPFGHVPGQPHDPAAWIQWIDDYANGRIYRFSLEDLKAHLAQHHERHERRGESIRAKHAAPKQSRRSPTRQASTKRVLGTPKRLRPDNTRSHRRSTDGIHSFADAEALLARGIENDATRNAVLNHLAAHLIWFKHMSAEDAVATLIEWAMNTRHNSKDIASDLANGTSVVAKQIRIMCRWYEAHNRNDPSTRHKVDLTTTSFAPAEIEAMRRGTDQLNGPDRLAQAHFLLHFLAYAKRHGKITSTNDGWEVAAAVQQVIRPWPGCSHKKYKTRIMHATDAGVLTLVKEKWQNPNGKGRARTYGLRVPIAVPEQESLDYEAALTAIIEEAGLGRTLEEVKTTPEPEPVPITETDDASNTGSTERSLETDSPALLEARTDTDLGTDPRECHPLGNAAQRVPNRHLRHDRTNRRYCDITIFSADFDIGREIVARQQWLMTRNPTQASGHKVARNRGDP